MDLMHFFSILMNLSTLVFIVTSMLAMGPSLTVAQIVPHCTIPGGDRDDPGARPGGSFGPAVHRQFIGQENIYPAA